MNAEGAAHRAAPSALIQSLLPFIDRGQRLFPVRTGARVQLRLVPDVTPLKAEVQKAQKNPQIDLVVERHLAGGHDPAPARLAHAVHAQGVAFAFHQPRLRVAGARRKPDNFGDALDGLPAPDFADRLPFAP